MRNFVVEISAEMTLKEFKKKMFKLKWLKGLRIDSVWVRE